MKYLITTFLVVIASSFLGCKSETTGSVGLVGDLGGVYEAETQTSEVMHELWVRGCYNPGQDELDVRVWLEQKFYGTYEYGKTQ